MDALSKLCAKLDYFIARARLWKQAAKLYRRRFRVVMDTLKLANYANDMAKDCYELSQARADRRLELLVELEDRALKCPLCGRLRDGYGLLAHAADCELAKELSDD